MTETLYADYSLARPDPHALSAVVAAVMRYQSGGMKINGLPKDLSASEASALHSAGLGIGSVWETYASRANEGFAAGVADGKAHNAAADALGIPTSVPLFYVGQDSVLVNIPNVVEYFHGVSFASKRGVGCYGGIDVVNAVHDSNWAHWFWQTEAWSGVNISPYAHLYQRAKATKPIPGCDENVLIQPFPLWTTPSPFPVPVQPKPIPAPTSAPKGLKVTPIDLSHVTDDPRSWVRAPGVAPLQRLLSIKVDGIGGPNTASVLYNKQLTMQVTADKVFGPLTAEALLAGK